MSLLSRRHLRLSGRIVFAALLLSGSLVRAQSPSEEAAARRAAIQSMYPVMIQALEAKTYGRARNICEQAIMWEPQNPMHHYNLACIEAQAGRLPQAFGALELSVTLGFNDPQHFQTDPDLAPLRNDPRFAALARKVADNAFGTKSEPPAAAPPEPAPAVSAATPAANTNAKKSSGPTPAPKADRPAPNSFQDGRPVGLYFMTRFWAATGSLEKAAWYFAPDGTVYQNLESGFSPDDLAAHPGPKGKCAAAGNKLEVTWSDGKKTSSALEPSESGTGFSWNAALFSAVKPFNKADELVGVYEGGESLSGSLGRAAVSKRLELRADGSFQWTGVTFASSTSQATRVTVGGTGGSTGQWQWGGLSLTLTDANGVVLRRIVFPYDDEKTPIKPDRMFFGGIMYKKQ